MKETFESAYNKLEQIIDEIQSGKVPLEELVDKIKQANQLISYCEGILKDISNQVKEILPDEKENNDSDLPF